VGSFKTRVGGMNRLLLTHFVLLLLLLLLVMHDMLSCSEGVGQVQL
jgi:hypothetical protein